MRLFLLVMFLVFNLTWSSGKGVPLSGQSYWSGKGLQAGMGLGMLRKAQCKSRFAWQGGFEYAYTPKWGGGAAARMFGGDIDEQHSLISTRYFFMARRHFTYTENSVLFVGANVGIDNSTFMLIRDEYNEEPQNPTNVEGLDESCKEAFDFRGATLAMDFGAGFMPFQYVGFNILHESEINADLKIRHELKLGTAIWIRDSWKRLQDNLQAAWIHIELLHSRTIGVDGFTNTWLLGYSLGF